MAAEPVLASAEQEDMHPDVLVSRQAVVDADMQVTGYRGGVARAYLGALRWAESVLEQTR